MKDTEKEKLRWVKPVVIILLLVVLFYFVVKLLDLFIATKLIYFVSGIFYISLLFNAMPKNYEFEFLDFLSLLVLNLLGLICIHYILYISDFLNVYSSVIMEYLVFIGFAFYLFVIGEQGKYLKGKRKMNQNFRLFIGLFPIILANYMFLNFS